MTALAARPSDAIRAELAALNPFPREAAAVDAALAGGDRLCAVAGHPIGHSRSPALFARLFGRYGLPYAYTRIDSPDPAAVLRLAARLDLRGLSVTLPLKEAMVPYCDTLSPDATADRGREHGGPVRGPVPRQQHGLARSAGAARAP